MLVFIYCPFLDRRLLSWPGHTVGLEVRQGACFGSGECQTHNLVTNRLLDTYRIGCVDLYFNSKLYSVYCQIVRNDLAHI